MWLEFIHQLSNDCKTHPPLSEAWVDKGLADLNLTLNDSLKAFLLETDGLYDYRQFLWMVWNVRDLSAYNLAMRNDDKFADKGYGFDDIFFIANRGDGGVLFGFPLENHTMQDHLVAWYPETSQRIQIADNLQAYLTHWINQKL